MNKITLMRGADGVLFLLMQQHRKFAEIMVRDASAIWMKKIPLYELAACHEAFYPHPTDIVVKRFLEPIHPNVQRDISPRVYEALAKHGL